MLRPARPSRLRLLIPIRQRRHIASRASPPQQHNDLASFQRYAEESGLSPQTTVYVGTLYEYTVLRTLSRLGMTLTRVGGRDDCGIDIRGVWTPPSPLRPSLEVYIQCKAERSRTGPKHLRELEGTMGLSLSSVPPLGILATTTPCTAGLRRHMLMSRMPLAYCCIAPYDRGGYLEQFLWNAAVGAMIGHGVGVTTRYIPVASGGGGRDEEIRTEAVLTVDGQVVDAALLVEGCHQ